MPLPPRITLICALLSVSGLFIPSATGARFQRGESTEKSHSHFYSDAPYFAFSVESSGIKQEEMSQSLDISKTYTNYNSEGYGGLQGDIMKIIAPVGGIYVFMATSMADEDGAAPLVLMHKDSDEVLVTSRSDASEMSAPWATSNQVILTLNKGDAVELKAKGTGSYTSSWMMEPSVVTFMGYLEKPI